MIPALRIKVGLVVRPLTNGFAYISNMPALSAPSAKILTLRSSTFFMFALALYDCQRFKCRRNSVVVLGGRWFSVRTIDEDGSATRGDAGLNVAAAVANHVAARQINVEFGGAGQQHSWPGFPAIAAVVVVVEANDEAINRRNFTRDQAIDAFDRFPGGRSACHVGLVRDHDQDEAAILETLELLAQPGIDLDIHHPRRRVRLALADHRVIQHTVTIKKDRPRFHRAGLTIPTADSHFVWLAFNFGCETSKCQTTA